MCALASFLYSLEVDGSTSQSLAACTPSIHFFLSRAQPNRGWNLLVLTVNFRERASDWSITGQMSVPLAIVTEFCANMVAGSVSVATNRVEK